MAPKTVRMVLLEGESAGGVTVDEDTFDVAPESAAAATADQVIAAILGTQESAAERGHQLQSSGVTWTDPVEADALRDALAAHKIENVAGSGGWVAQPPGHRQYRPRRLRHHRKRPHRSSSNRSRPWLPRSRNHRCIPGNGTAGTTAAGSVVVSDPERARVFRANHGWQNGVKSGHTGNTKGVSKAT